MKWINSDIGSLLDFRLKTTKILLLEFIIHLVCIKSFYQQDIDRYKEICVDNSYFNQDTKQSGATCQKAETTQVRVSLTPPVRHKFL